MIFKLYTNRLKFRRIVDASRRLYRDEDLSISFIQIGNDHGAKKFLKWLDDDLRRQGKNRLFEFRIDKLSRCEIRHRGYRNNRRNARIKFL